MADESDILIHYLVPDDAGPVASGGLVLNTPQGPQRVAPARRYRAACSPDLRIDGLRHRATGDTRAVHCAACAASGVFARDRLEQQGPPPSERQLAAAGARVTAPDDGGCCG